MNSLLGAQKKDGAEAPSPVQSFVSPDSCEVSRVHPFRLDSAPFQVINITSISWQIPAENSRSLIFFGRLSYVPRQSIPVYAFTSPNSFFPLRVRIVASGRSVCVSLSGRKRAGFPCRLVTSWRVTPKLLPIGVRLCFGLRFPKPCVQYISEKNFANSKRCGISVDNRCKSNFFYLFWNFPDARLR